MVVHLPRKQTTLNSLGGSNPSVSANKEKAMSNLQRLVEIIREIEQEDWFAEHAKMGTQASVVCKRKMLGLIMKKLNGCADPGQIQVFLNYEYDI